jgi:hypothetical protein
VCVFECNKSKRNICNTRKKELKGFLNKFNSIFYSALSAGQNVPAELKSSEGVK